MFFFLIQIPIKILDNTHTVHSLMYSPTTCFIINMLWHYRIFICHFQTFIKIDYITTVITSHTCSAGEVRRVLPSVAAVDPSSSLAPALAVVSEK